MRFLFQADVQFFLIPFILMLGKTPDAGAEQQKKGLMKAEGKQQQCGLSGACNILVCGSRAARFFDQSGDLSVAQCEVTQLKVHTFEDKQQSPSTAVQL